MKRRVPMINQGEFVLALRNDPPHTDEAKRHGPTTSHPGSADAALQAAASARRA
jgi:hypothetical protein